MTTTLARQAVRLFPSKPYLALSGVKHNRRAWIAAVLDLGDKWILATNVTRKAAA